MGNIDSVPSQPSHAPGTNSTEPFRIAPEAAEESLHAHLAQGGFSTNALAAWAASLEGGPAPLLQDLAAEVRAGLSRLECDEAGVLQRLVSVVEVTMTASLRTGDAVLIQEERIFSDGLRRPRRCRPQLKLRPGEAPLAGAARVLRHRLGLSSEVVDRLLLPISDRDEATRGEGRSSSEEPEVEQAVSSTFPGLRTRYAVHRVQFRLGSEAEVLQLGLPVTDSFATLDESTPSAPSTGAAAFGSLRGSLHLWRWVDSDLAACGGSLSDLSQAAAAIEASAEAENQDCASTALEETYKDLQAVIKLLELQKDTQIVRAGRAQVEGMQERLRRVMQRMSNVEELVHQVNIEGVLSQLPASPSSHRSSRTSAPLGNDLRDFISNNFMEHTVPEPRGGMVRSKTVCVSERKKTPRTSIKNRRYTIGVGSAGTRSSSAPPTPKSPHPRFEMDGERSASSSDSGSDGEVTLRLKQAAAVHDDKAEQISPSSRSAVQTWQDSRKSVGAHGAQNLAEVWSPGSKTWPVNSVAFTHCQTEPRQAAGDSAERGRGRSRSGSKDLTSPWEACVGIEVEALQNSGGDREWVLDCLTISEHTNAGSLLVAAELFVLPQVDEFGTTEDTMRSFISALHGRYLQNLNPFHSEAHVALVTHATRWLSMGGKGWHVAHVVERVGTEIAALAHDAGHFRRNNAFCINTGNWLALTYNDRSVLENMHAATCFQLMAHEDRDILCELSKENRKFFRDHVVDLILATDMASHFEFLGQFRITAMSDNFDPEGDCKNRELVTKCCLKAADLGHTALPWDLHEPWVLRLLTEFYEQGDEEQAMGLPVSPMCSHSDDLSVFKEGQKGFLQFVVLPLYKELSQVLLDQDISGTCIQRIEQNGEQWGSRDKELSPEIVSVVTGKAVGEVSPEVAARKLSPSSWLAPSEKRQALALKQGDQVRIIKEGPMKGKLAVVLNSSSNGLVRVKTEVTDAKGDTKSSYHISDLQLAIATIRSPGAQVPRMPQRSSGLSGKAKFQSQPA